MYLGDGICDDSNSIKLCNFDGGDCCSEGDVGDGYCEDDINIESCNYDGNDCCMPIIMDDYCLECICHEDGTKHESITISDYYDYNNMDFFPTSTSNSGRNFKVLCYLTNSGTAFLY